MEIKASRMQQITITLDLSQSTTLIIELNVSASKPVLKALENEVRNTAVVCLYKHGMISILEAADLIGCSFQRFEEFFDRYRMMDTFDLDLETMEDL